ncbi:CHRD domain-containing protein [Isoptericola croceus]|uniref:CHRD domain-containing protein n=1 Tax=Isoptericola croceus TaxID=3031406 RepID=UPI0023F6D0E6|nr:CHRD domain-containing protein [Isoptericola croceus]
MSTNTSFRVRCAAAVAALGIAGAVLATPATAAPNSFPLNVGQETTGSNTGASGKFSYTIDGGELCYTLSARNLSVDAVAAHVHVAPRHVDGPIVIPLSVGAGTSFTVSDCVPADADVLADLDANPRSYYVNVHTPTFPGGEIRGQFTH